MMKTAEKLTAARGSKTREEVCNAIGISVQSLTAYETGKRIPRDSIKQKLADYYGQSVADLFFLQDEEEPYKMKAQVVEISEQQYKDGIEAQMALSDLSRICQRISAAVKLENGTDPCIELGVALSRVLYHASQGHY